MHEGFVEGVLVEAVVHENREDSDVPHFLIVRVASLEQMVVVPVGVVVSNGKKRLLRVIVEKTAVHLGLRTGRRQVAHEEVQVELFSVFEDALLF